jgi:diguanylate cyclase (GGDEF)-like protein
MLFGSRGPQGFLPQAWVGVVLLVQIAVALRWFFGPLPVRRDFIGFAVFGDVGLTSVLVLYEPLGGLIGCGLFVVTGALCTYFLSQKLLLAHLGWCVVVIVVEIIRAGASGGEDVPTVLAVGIVILGINTGIPLLAHIAWTAIGRDARRSLVDPLTGLLNRRGLDDAAEELVSRSQELGQCLVVLVIDIDRFKQVNDYFGHDTGDRVIVTVSDRLAALFRQDGVVARTGGEEFVVVFRAPYDTAHARIGQVGHALYRRDDYIPVTVSVGAAIIARPGELRELSVVTRATRAADSMMYRAKYDGGNRTASTFL